MAPVPEPSSPDTTSGDELSYQAGPQVIQVSSDSDSDFEDDPNDGYVQLAQGPDGPELGESDCSDAEGAESTIPEASSTGTRVIPEMPEDQANEIKAVMAKIKLPNVPLWARHIPEQQWMSSLMANLTHKKPDTEPGSATETAATVESPSKVPDNPTQPALHTADFDANFEANFPNT